MNIEIRFDLAATMRFMRMCGPAYSTADLEAAASRLFAYIAETITGRLLWEAEASFWVSHSTDMIAVMIHDAPEDCDLDDLQEVRMRAKLIAYDVLTTAGLVQAALAGQGEWEEYVYG